MKSNLEVNSFSITPAVATEFVVDGNEPVSNSLTVLGPDDGRELISYGSNSGRFEFDTFANVQFFNFTL